jgi:hypothetical protein
MPATPEIIPSDLTLEIGEDLSPERFMAAARAFFGYIKEISHTLAPEGEEPHWVVRVREGSTLLAIDPTPNVPKELVQAVYARAELGLRHLNQGTIDNSGLPELALKHLKSLSELTEIFRDNPNAIRLWVKRKPLVVGANIAEIIREEWRTDYSDIGTIEGRFQTIQDKDGSLQFQIYDALFRQTIRCYFPEEMLSQVFNSFRKRVEVYGEIHYRRNGTPISIHAERIEKLPDDDELPTLDDVQRIFRAEA